MNTKCERPTQVEAQDVVSYHMNEVIGCAEEFRATPCKSLADRLREAALRATREIAAINGWQKMDTAPVGDASACIDIWCADDDCRRTNCFWEPEAKRWVYEDFESGAYRTRGVKRPVAWMQTPEKPEGV